MLRLIGVGDNVVDCNYTTGIMYPGGNSLNFSVYGRQLGHETAYAGVLGTDIQADMVVHALEDKGVDISRCVRVQGETGICGIRRKDGDRTITDENDAGVVKSHPLQITEELLEYIKTFDVVHSSCFSHIEDQLVKIRETGVPLLYDFSDVWEEKDLAAVCPDITIAFFSGKDLGEEKLKELLHRCVHGYGCRLAVTTIGSRGAIVYNGRKYYRKLPYNFEAPVADTTGAGDSWITAFISSYIENKGRMDRLHEEQLPDFTRQADREDYEDQLIEFSMCAGNLLARHNCLVEGSFGYGTAF